jgi:hypothetical protein
MALTSVQATLLGREFAEILGLKVEGDRIYTSWGSKTHEGLGRVVARLVQEARLFDVKALDDGSEYNYSLDHNGVTHKFYSLSEAQRFIGGL